MDSKKSSPESIEARILLGKSYIELHRSSEAYLLSNETEALLAKTDTFGMIKNLLIRAEALLQMKISSENKKASLILDSLRNEVEKKAFSKELVEKIYTLSVEEKLRQCDTLQLNHSINEAQTLDLMERRGYCILEAILYLKKKTEPISHKRVIQSIQSYQNACKNPNTSYIKSVTPDQQKRVAYRKELIDKLVPLCREKINQVYEFINQFKANSK